MRELGPVTSGGWRITAYGFFPFASREEFWEETLPEIVATAKSKGCLPRDGYIVELWQAPNDIANKPIENKWVYAESPAEWLPTEDIGQHLGGADLAGPYAGITYTKPGVPLRIP